MNKTNECSIHPYCFIFAQPASTAAMQLVDCTEQAKQAEVHNNEGFIYSEYTPNGATKPLKVGYRFPKGFTPASADTFFVEILVDDTEGHTYGSIVAGTILSPTEIKPAMHIQCGDRAHGGDPRIIDADKAGMTFTTAATLEMCLNPEVRQEVHVAGAGSPIDWKSYTSTYSSPIKTSLAGACNNPGKQAGKWVHYFDSRSLSLELIKVDIEGADLAVAA